MVTVSSKSFSPSLLPPPFLLKKLRPSSAARASITQSIGRRRSATAVPFRLETCGANGLNRMRLDYDGGFQQRQHTGERVKLARLARALYAAFHQGGVAIPNLLNATLQVKTVAQNRFRYRLSIFVNVSW